VGSAKSSSVPKPTQVVAYSFTPSRKMFGVGIRPWQHLAMRWYREWRCSGAFVAWPEPPRWRRAAVFLGGDIAQAWARGILGLQMLNAGVVYSIVTCCDSE